jgi:hypothetical protein
MKLMAEVKRWSCADVEVRCSDVMAGMGHPAALSLISREKHFIRAKSTPRRRAMCNPERREIRLK